jgi:hypothetical protein
MQTIFLTRNDAAQSAYERCTVADRIMFVSITPWGAFEVSSHSIPLNAPILRYRITRNSIGSNHAMTERNVTNWRRN